MMALPVLTMAAAAGVVLTAVMWKRPKAAVVIWLLSVAMVPSWIGISAFPVQSAVGLLAIAAVAGSFGLRLDGFDLYFGGFIALALIILLLGGGDRALFIDFVVKWALSYAVARVVLPACGVRFATDAVALVFALVGALAILEFIFHWHPFVGFMTSFPEYATWGEIQVRSGVERSEWAFGHSIALGGSLALAIPFILGASFGFKFRVFALLLVLGGIATTLSRGAMIAAGLTIFLCLLAYLTKRGLQFAMVFAGCVAVTAVAFVPGRLVQFAFGATSETQESASYRERLYDTLLPDLVPFGKASYPLVSQDTSIDSAFLYVGMHFGWIIVVMLLAPFLLVVVRTLSGKASLFEVGVAGQLPLLATVSLITQYQSFLFFTVGFAVQVAVADRMSSNLDAIPRNSRAGAKLGQV
jgi:hypothetical protein